jgi:hypothetical protein
MGDEGKKLEGKEIDLVGWAPPANWAERVLEETVTDGTAITFSDSNFGTISEAYCVKFVEEHVIKSREKFPFTVPDDIPNAAFALACIRHHSPLPSEFWRSVIFPPSTKAPAST